MRSVPAASFARLASFPSLWGAWQDYRQGKRRRPAVAAFDLDADLAILDLHRELAAGRYAPSPYRLSLVIDPKVRLVAAPAVRDRVLQRALLDTIGPTYERGFIDHSYAVGSGRGAHRAALAYLGWLRDYRYRLHLDIRHYFASIGHARLLALFERRLKDPRTLALIADWLGRERGLTLKHPGAEPLDNRLPAVFLGFRVSRAGIGPGPKAVRRLRRRLRRADHLDPAQLARSLLAFRGMWGALGG